MTIEQAHHRPSRPPGWPQRPTAITNAAIDTYVLVQQNLVGHQPYDLQALHEGLRGIHTRLHTPTPPRHDPDTPPPTPSAQHQQDVARFIAGLQKATNHHRAHTELDLDYHAELVELAAAAHTLAMR